MRKINLLSILICLNAYSLELSYDDIVTYTLNNATSLKYKQTEKDIENANLELLYSKLYPQLSMLYSADNYESLDEQRQNVSVGDKLVNSSVKYKNSLGLNLSYELYDFGVKDEQIKAQKQEITIKQLEECAQELKIKEEILKHYTNAINAKYDKDYLTQSRSFVKQIYEYKKRLFDSGNISLVEVSNESMRLIDFENRIDEANKEYQTSLVALSHISYNFVDPLKTILLPLESKNEFKKEKISYDESYLAEQYRLKLIQKQHERKSFLFSNLPQVGLSSNYYLYGADDEHYRASTQDIRRNSYSIGLSVRVNLFEGFKYSNQMNKFDLETQKIFLEDTMAKEDFEKEIETSQENIQQLNNLLLGNNKNLEESKKMVATKIRLNENGELDTISKLQSVLDLLDKELITKHKQTSLSMEQIKLNIRKGICK